MKNKTFILGLVFIFALGLGGSAFAETNNRALLNVNAGASISGGSNSESNSTNSEGTVQVDANAQSRSNSASSNGSSMILLRSDVSAEGNSENESSWDRSSWMNNSSTVSSDEGLKAYVSSAMRADENFNKVDSNDDHVSVSYKERAKLFGFIPVSVRATSTVDSEGNVKVRYPWYRFLMSTHKSEIESKINADIQAMGWKKDGSGNASFNAATRAKLVSSMYSAMHRDDSIKE